MLRNEFKSLSLGWSVHESSDATADVLSLLAFVHSQAASPWQKHEEPEMETNGTERYLPIVCHCTQFSCSHP